MIVHWGIIRSHVFFLFLITFSQYVYAQNSKQKPNVIFVICDQMRGDAFGAAGNKVVNTPHLDRMAEQGVMFSNNISNSPVCLSSRMSMFSGKYASQTGVRGNKYPENVRLEFERSLPWYFKENGYRTGYIGKNHAFQKEELNKFDRVVIRERDEYRSYSKYVPPYWHSDIFWPEEDSNPGKNTREAIEFIEETAADQPFFLVVSYFDPHPPYMAPAEYTSKYCSSEMLLPEYIDPSTLSPRLAIHQKALRYDKMTEGDLRETMRYYYASVEWGVDRQVGELMQALEGKGIDKNTIIVFTADHGDFMGEYNMVRKAMFLYDALLRVPMLWYAPGLIESGKVVKGVSQNADIFPTLLDLSGISIPGFVSGVSLKGVLTGAEGDISMDRKVYAHANYSELPSDYWDDPEPYYNPESDVPFHTRIEQRTWQNDFQTSMVRTSNWKLILSDTHDPELYFMDGGHVERKNLYGDELYERKYKELEESLRE